MKSCSKGEIPGRAKRKERLSRSKLKQAFQIDSDAELFMNLIQCIRFGSWKVRRLNLAWISVLIKNISNVNIVDTCSLYPPNISLLYSNNTDPQRNY